ncbi:TetR/AcrR family transcriptional regulator [Nocardioides sp. NPDC126508]
MAGEKRDGRQERWSKHNEQRRQQIIDAAIAVIEAGEPGADVQVQQIAVRAGLSRTVIYRHFEDRADLDRAVQQAILDGLWSDLMPGITLDGTVPQIIERIIGTYVRWARAHPALHLAADHDIEGGDDGPLQQGMEQLAGRISTIVGTAVIALGGNPTEEEAEALDPLIYGLVGAVFGAVRRWLTRTGERLPAETLERLTAQSIWYVIDGHARGFGIELDPDLPLEELLSKDVLAV